MKQPINLYIGTPCFGGQVYENYLLSIMALQRLCDRQGICVNLHTIGNESLVTRARNTLVADFLDHADTTHLLFIDADIGFHPDLVLRMLDFDKDVMTAIYPRKSINWDKVQNRVRDGVPVDQLLAASLTYNITFLDPKNITPEQGFVETMEAATGFMMIRRDVLERMKNTYPELRYQSDQIVNSKLWKTENSYLFFDCMKCPDTGRYLSEDYAFCRRWRNMGGRIHADISSPLSHMGTFKFNGNVSATMTRRSP